MNAAGNSDRFSRGESFSAAALMNKSANHTFDAPGGIAFRLNPDGYQKASSAEKDKVASFVNKWLEKNKDPAADIPGAAPLFGQDVAPHAMTFASKIGSQAKTYLPSDESLENNPNDALLMRKDLGIMECLEIRQRMSALLDWSIVPEDSKSPAQKAIAAEITKIVKRIKRFTEYRRCLMDAIWIGRSAIQHTYGHGIVSGRMYCYPRAKHTDATGWKHIHGDKVVFRYDDGEKLPAGAFPDQMGVRVSAIIQKDARLRGIQDVEYTNSGAAIFLSPAERQTVICHKHMIEDAEYANPRKAGRIHGVGIRDRIYNEWFLKQELLGFLIEYMERSAGGIEIYEYPSGDEAAKRSMMDAAKNRMAFGRNQIFFPKPLGMDSGVYDLRIVEPGFAGIDMLLNVLDKYFGHRIKRYIIGQTLSTEADATGLGSSVADFQKDSLSQIVRYDSCNLDETITHELVRPIQLVNWPETEAWQFEYKAELESDNAKEKLDAMRTAWEMGCGIPEKDVAETVGVSLDNPNEKMLRNASAGMAPGSGGNGMQFPAGTGFGNQIDAAHEHVKAAGEVKGIKDGVIDHVAGKLGDGAPSSPADGPEKYEREFSEADHPRDNAGKFTESSKTGDSISVPELGRRSAFDAHIVDSDDPENATVSSLDKEGKPYWKTSVPKKSLHQFHSDLTGDFSYLQKFGSSGNESIDAVISGKGKMIGKGDDSIVFETPDGKVVKASTTVPYHAVGGPSHLTPDAAMQQAKVKFGVLQDMKKAGISGIPDTVGIEHGDKFFTVQEKMQIGTPMNREQLQQVKDSVESMHKAGYEIQDELQVGIGPDGKARHYDLGKASPASYDLRRRDEMNEVASLWKKNGQTWNLPIDEAVQKTEVAQRMAMRDISGGRPVRQQAKEMLKASIDSFNYHGDWDKAFDLHNWLLDNNIMDVYARQMSLWDEEEHPRDEVGKFAEKGDSRVSSSPAETLPDGKVRMKQAKAGGETSDVDGKFYKGGRLMPVHGLYSGREKPAPKPKKENPFGSLPVVSEDGKGLPSARKRTDEQIGQERQEMADKAAWLSVQSGPVRDMVWVGDKPGKTAYEVKKQLVPFLSGLSDEQVQQIGEFAFQSVVDHEQEQYPDVDRETIESEFNNHAAYTADLLLSKKIRKEFPSMERTVEAIRQYSDLPDQLQRWVEMDEHLRDVLGAESPSSSADESPEPKKNTGPAGLTKSEAIQKAKKGGTGLLKHAEAVSATMIYLGTNSGQWSAVPVEDMVEMQDSKGNGRTVPQFATPKDYTHVETPWTSMGSGGEFCCELCATPIKNAFQIQNDEKKWLMTVGSECVTKFGDGMSGEQLAKKDMQKKRRDLVKVSHEAIRGFAEKIKEEKQGKNLTLQDVARAIGNDESRKRFWNVAKSLGIDPYSTQWRIDKDGVVHDDDFKHLDGFATREKSTDQKISNWHKKNSEAAEMMLKDLKRFGVDVEKYARRSHRLLNEAASSTHTSPTMAQREAGNYSKGIFPWKGLEIAIENPKGSERCGCSSSGREWFQTMKCHYGYFRRTAANDGDNLDVFIGAHPDSDFVLVIKQVDQEDRTTFDEFKVVVGCLNRKEAKKLYLANYPAGWKCGPAASMTVDLFKEWIAKGGPMRAKSLAKVEC